MFEVMFFCNYVWVEILIILYFWFVFIIKGYWLEKILVKLVEICRIYRDELNKCEISWYFFW